MKAVNEKFITELQSIIIPVFSQSAYAKIEADVTKLDIERLQMICSILEIDVSELLQNQDGKVINYSNNTIQNVNGFVENLYNGIKEQYESQISSLKEEISFLKSLINLDKK